MEQPFLPFKKGLDYLYPINKFVCNPIPGRHWCDLLFGSWLRLNPACHQEGKKDSFTHPDTHPDIKDGG
jgi:hypothetical protein